MLYKVLRKLKLGKGAYALLYPFRGKADVLPGTEEARALPLLAAEASSFCWARAASCSCLARLA